MIRRFLEDRLGINWFSGREGERSVDYFRSLLKETDKKEFSFIGIESKMKDIQDEMRVIVD